ncbi:MAG: hypothetical protein A2381_06055 [Bdellovibrionales bacterium RIFOXYB1_FULL_37_110]|nr:MAG: hypothetical protein A2417_04940 [Bdellovibrionales bacterium RIFOXYC1_FULL_37_79]OFZ55334.1 MAG: hypothetical protein A2328_05970 [Bdellovibrionales bacterium RIFOXYB2_FULL_36_6]OFZ59382.1 MAG: hypothetical protein A2381_06055 [Bdellovibrionales bacterium RIFOXYB1_FULL_37_110]OFZ61942.1 MAG: hypothetical protein A2577_17940 [Bdellovibrionales bacterium RIFOXYD1_FULL_36_51]
MIFKSLMFILTTLITTQIFAQVTSVEFGQDVMKTPGTKKLMVILAEHSGKNPLVHDMQYYKNLFWGFEKRSINEYFRLNSQGKFFWLPATTLPIFGPYQIARTASTSLKTAIENALKAVKASGTDFSSFDSNQDQIITNDELTVVLLDNWTEVAGVSTSTCDDVSCISLDGYRLEVKVALAGHRASFMTIAHEMTHTLGGLDLYGALVNHNNDLTTMDATVIANNLDNMDSYHLDPWHKMAFGWITPKVYDLNTARSLRLFAPANWKKYDSVILYDANHGEHEFFMVEYRTKLLYQNQASLDEAVASNGLVIWRINLKSDLMPDWYPITDKAGDYAIFALAYPDLAKGKNTAWPVLSLTSSLTWEDGISSPFRVNIHQENTSEAALDMSWFNTNFFRIPGCIKEISVGIEGRVWALDCTQDGTGNHYVRYYNPRLNNWLVSPMTGVKISVDLFGKTPWVVKKNGEIYNLTSNTWMKVQGCASDIAAAAFGKIFILGCQASGPLGSLKPVYQKVGNQWKSMNFSGSSIATDPSGKNPWVLGPTGMAHRFDGSAWKKILNCSQDLSFDKYGKVFSVSCENANATGNTIYFGSNAAFQSTDWIGKKISVIPDGSGIWIINAIGQVTKSL